MIFGVQLLTSNVDLYTNYKVEFGRNEFSKKKLQSKINFQKNLRDQVNKIIDQLHLSKSIPIVCLKIISCQEIGMYNLGKILLKN